MARLAFFGTPEFAVPSLEALLEAQADGHEVVLVVCQPDRPKGRGKAVQPPPVKARALEAGVPVIEQPLTLKKGTPEGDSFYERFTSLDVDLAVVAAYGRILPKRVLAVPKRGFVNVHASLLPRWRGAAPIQRAIEAGDAETGVCLMDMIYELDAGDVYLEKRVAIAPDDDGETLTKKLALLGKEALKEGLPGLIAGTLEKTPQPAEGVTYAHMLEKDEGRIRWARPARDVVNHARAMYPWPGAWTELDGETLKLFRPSVVEGVDVDALPPGTVIAADHRLLVVAEGGAVAFAEGQLPGKKRMAIADLVRGRAIDVGAVLG